MARSLKIQFAVIILVILINSLITTGDLISKREQLSSRREGVGGIRVEDRFYFAGGFEFNDLAPSKIVDIYNISSGEWQDPIYLDEPRGQAIVASYYYQQND
eukprot:TRINITY_DN4030_c0_g1_i1.p1 TRINITY_DN4030_c0_g1~~TRINITY_DN4030_c0_g1_i1.p1  ORF type:complete len:102 (+),score=9.90 TRINITY_DN4030_c0_g1_i1:319-624(+)